MSSGRRAALLTQSGGVRSPRSGQTPSFDSIGELGVRGSCEREPLGVKRDGRLARVTGVRTVESLSKYDSVMGEKTERVDAYLEELLSW